MVNATLSGCFSSSAFGEHGQALVADLGKAAGDRDLLGLAGRGAIDRDLAVAQRRHVRRMARHDALFAFGTRNDDHVDVVGHYLAVRSHEFKMQVGHYCLPSIFASNVLAAASNLSRHPMLQKPTTLPL